MAWNHVAVPITIITISTSNKDENLSPTLHFLTLSYYPILAFNPVSECELAPLIATMRISELQRYPTIHGQTSIILHEELPQQEAQQVTCREQVYVFQNYTKSNNSS